MLACMPLTDAIPIGFIPSANAEAARAFYEGILGLRFVADEPFALVFRLGPEAGFRSASCPGRGKAPGVPDLLCRWKS